MQTSPISVTAPVGEAIEHVKAVLFRPFDLRRWLTIGFCAWLAWLGDGGVGGGGTGGRGNLSGRDSLPGTTQTKQWFADNWAWLVPVVIGGAILLVALGLVITWVSSRGKFMFLHNVLTNRAEIKLPWARYAGSAKSLFLFRVALGLVSLGLLAVPAAALIWMVVRLGNWADTELSTIGLMVALSLIVFGIAILCALATKVTTDFVVPLMFMRGVTCLDGWRELLKLAGAHVGSFGRYLLFQIVMAVAILAVIAALVLATCCVAGCLLAIPYVGAVLLLPILVFDRAYSLYFLRQFGPTFDALAEGAQLAEAMPQNPAGPV